MWALVSFLCPDPSKQDAETLSYEELLLLIGKEDGTAVTELG